MKNIKEQVLEKIRKDLDGHPQKVLYWDNLIEWFAYIRALSDFRLLTDEEVEELSDFIDEHSI